MMEIKKDDIRRQVLEIMAEQLGRSVESIADDNDISNDLGADSLDAAELLIAFEEKFDIEIDEDSSQNFSTVKDVVDKIYQLKCENEEKGNNR